MNYEQDQPLTRRAFNKTLFGGVALFLPALMLSCSTSITGKSRFFIDFPGGNAAIELGRSPEGTVEPGSGTLVLGMEEGFFRNSRRIGFPFRDPQNRLQLYQALLTDGRYSLITETSIGRPNISQKGDLWLSRTEVDTMDELTLVARWTGYNVVGVSLNDKPLTRISSIPGAENLIKA